MMKEEGGSRQEGNGRREKQSHIEHPKKEGSSDGQRKGKGWAEGSPAPRNKEQHTPTDDQGLGNPEGNPKRHC